MDSDDYIEKILSLADVRKLMGTKMRQWPALQRSEFIAALGMCLDFDFYLFRSPPAGRPEFLEKWNDAIENFSPGKAALIGARHPKDIVDICEQIYILDGNRLLYFPHMEGALEYCSTLSNADFGKRGKTKPLDFEEEEEDADDGAF